jgi:hypothetical protein
MQVHYRDARASPDHFRLEVADEERDVDIIIKATVELDRRDGALLLFAPLQNVKHRCTPGSRCQHRCTDYGSDGPIDSRFDRSPGGEVR